MAKRKRSSRGGGGRSRSRTGSVSEVSRPWTGEALEASIVPQLLIGAVNGVETVAEGLLQLTRNVLVSAVSGAADIGAEALGATVSGARGVVSAASRTVGNIAGVAQTSVMEAIDNARHLGSRASLRTARRPLASVTAPITGPSEATSAATPQAGTGRTRRPRMVRQQRAKEAA